MLGAVTRVSVPLGSLMVVAAIITWATGLSQRASDAVELDSSVAAHLMGGQIDADHKCIASISCTAMWDTLRPCPGANQDDPCNALPCATCENGSSVGYWCKSVQNFNCEYDGGGETPVDCGVKNDGNCPRAVSSSTGDCIGGLCYDQGANGTCGTLHSLCQ